MDDPALQPAAPPATPPASPGAGARSHHFEFSGSASEYFRVWIVNVALTIVTVGIYSAWAKVRNKQYFYGNTRLAGGSFEYTANPVNILKGRLLVLGVFVAYQAASAFQPILALVMFVVLIPLVPWVVVRAIGFNLRYSSYRGLRFHFDGRYGEAFKLYILWTLVVMVSFGLAYPYVAWLRRKFLVERARYGQTGFAFSADVSWFYVVYIVASIAYVGIFLAIALLVAGGVGIAAATGLNLEDVEGTGEGAAVLALVLTAVVYVAFLLALIVLTTGVQAMIANHVWQRTALADVRFDLRLNLWRMVWIQASNIVAIIFSLGLLIPWARVRMVRYKLSCFTMIAVPAELDRFVAAERDKVTATGDEFGEALDLDLGL